MKKADIGLIGLAVMGENLVLNMETKGFAVAVYNRTTVKWIQFGWAFGALATTFLTDYAQPADEDMVWSVWGGNARVKR